MKKDEADYIYIISETVQTMFGSDEPEIVCDEAIIFGRFNLIKHLESIRNSEFFDAERSLNWIWDEYNPEDLNLSDNDFEHLNNESLELLFKDNNNIAFEAILNGDTRTDCSRYIRTLQSRYDAHVKEFGLRFK